MNETELNKIKKEWFIKGYNAAIEKIFNELSYDPEYQDVKDYLAFRIKLNNVS